MATGWAGDGAVQDQIDATVKDGVSRAQSRLAAGSGTDALCGMRRADSRGASQRHSRRAPVRDVPGSRRTAKRSSSAATTGAAARTASCAESTQLGIVLLHAAQVQREQSHLQRR